MTSPVYQLFPGKQSLRRYCKVSSNHCVVHPTPEPSILEQLHYEKWMRSWVLVQTHKTKYFVLIVCSDSDVDQIKWESLVRVCEGNVEREVVEESMISFSVIESGKISIVNAEFGAFVWLEREQENHKTKEDANSKRHHRQYFLAVADAVILLVWAFRHG